MKKLISLLLALILVLSLPTGFVFAENETVELFEETAEPTVEPTAEPTVEPTVISLSETERTVVSPLDCQRTNITNIDEMIENGCLMFSVNNYLELDVTVQTAGFYDLAVCIGAGTDKLIKVTVNANLPEKELAAATGGLMDQQERVLRTVYLKEGQTTIKLVNSSTGTYYFKNIVFIPSEGTVLSDEAAAVVDPYMYTYSSSGISYDDRDGSVIVAKSKVLNYKLNVKKAGLYKFDASVGCPSDFNVTTYLYDTVNATTTFGYTNTLLNTGGYREYAERNVRYMYLAEGENTIRIKSESGTFYLESLKFTFVEGIPVLGEGEEEFSALFYSKASNIRDENNNLVPKSNGYAEYSFDVETAGYYDISMTFGTDGSKTIESTINGNMAISAIPESTGGATKTAKRHIRTSYLQEGVNTIRFKQIGGSDFYFKSVSLAKVDGISIAEEGETVFSALQYSSQSNTRISGDDLVLGGYGYTEYIVDIKKDGLYKLSVNMGSPSDKTFTTTVDGTRGYTVDAAKTPGYTTREDRVLREVFLSEGAHTIKIAQEAGAEFHIRSFALEFVADALAISDSQPTKFSAMQYVTAKDVRTENGAIVPLQNGSMSYKILVAQTGLYELHICYGTKGERKVVTTVDGENSHTATLADTTNYTVYQTAKARTMLLEEGTHVLKISNATSEFYIKDIELIPAGGEEIGLELGYNKISAFDYDNYYDTTRIPGIEINDDGSAVELLEEEYFEYIVTVPQAGSYGIALNYACLDTEEKQIGISVNGGDNITLSVVGSGSANEADFRYSAMQVITLEEGENTISIEALSGDWYLEGFKILYPGAQFYDVYTGGEPVEEVPADLYGKVYFGGLLVGENVDCYMAVYETNASGAKKLVGADVVSLTVAEKSIPTLQIKGIEKKSECTYSAKIFVWQNMAGREFVLN